MQESVSPTSKSFLQTDLSHSTNNEVSAEEQAAAWMDTGVSDYQPFLDVIDEMCGLEYRLHRLKEDMLSSAGDGNANSETNLQGQAVVLVPAAELKEKSIA